MPTKQLPVEPLICIESRDFDDKLGEIHELLRAHKQEFLNWVRAKVAKHTLHGLPEGTAAGRVVEFELLNKLTHELTGTTNEWLRLFGKDNRPPESHLRDLEARYAGLMDDYDPEDEAINGEVQPGLPYLHSAVMNDDLDEVQRLVKAGADTLKKDNGGRTAYGRARAMGNLRIAEFLQQYPH